MGIVGYFTGHKKKGAGHTRESRAHPLHAEDMQGMSRIFIIPMPEMARYNFSVNQPKKGAK
jgi:hypothetical protein